MADADQAGHRLHGPPVPPGAATLQPQPQRLRLPFYLPAAYRAACQQAPRVVQPVRVLAEVADQPLRRPAAPLALPLVADVEQLAHPLADPDPALARQQAPAALVGGAGLARLFAEDPLGALAEVLAGVEEVQRLHAA